MRRAIVFAIIGIICLTGGSFSSDIVYLADTSSVRSHVITMLNEVRRLNTKQTVQAIDSALIILDSVRSTTIEHFGPLDSLSIAALTWQGASYARNTNFESCDSTLRLAIELWKESLGPEVSNVGNTMRLLANEMRRRSRFAEAEPLYIEACRILEENPRTDVTHQSRIAAANLELGALYAGQGRYSRALEMYTKAHEVYVKALGEKSRRDGFGLYYMGSANINLGNYVAAESLLTRALEIYENTVGEDHPETVEILSSLGRLSRKQRNPPRAKQFLSRALEISERIGGNRQANTRHVLRELAAVAGNEQDYKAASAHLKRTLAIEESLYGADFHNLTSVLSSLGKAEYLLGENDYLDRINRWIDLRHRFYQNVFTYASEEQKLRYLHTYRSINPLFLSISLQDANPKSTELAIEMVLNGKSLAVDALAAERTTAYCSDDEEVRSRLVEHSDVCSRIANLTLTGGNVSISPSLQRTLEQLYLEKSRLETELSHLCAALTTEFDKKRVTARDVTDDLPENAVLWEFIKYQPYLLEGTGEDDQLDVPHYLAMILTRSGCDAIVDLGEASLIDSLVTDCREKLQSASIKIFLLGTDETDLEADFSNVMGQLYNLVWLPLEERSGSSKRVFISPDGLLNLLPFDILPCSDGEYVIENFEVSYLTSGRDLLDFGPEVEEPNRLAVVLADPDYDQSAAQSGMIASVSAGNEYSQFRSPSPNGECLTSPFGLLAATGIEAEIIDRLLSKHTLIETAVYVGQDASEEALKQISVAPAILHLATHGYHCDPSLADRTAYDFKNPLIQSGLALAGANQTILSDGPDSLQQLDDGILTALEASAINLVGTDLVVLSACLSGVGQIQNGEGVFGLRRALQHAGARSVVMSMFAVPDKTTVSLMERFYENWLTGQSKSSALRNASLSILRERRKSTGAAHPLFWGGFVLVGDPD